MAQTPNQYYGTGRRKSSVARVYLRPGNGKIVVNRREFDDYFPRATHRQLMVRALTYTENNESFDVFVNVCGGGQGGQAGAVQLGIARALLEYDPSARETLKRAGLLTRDARKVERKKYGRPGARKRFQFSKR